ncbi:MAG: hypothetical protein NT116_00255 [Candidatus Parcubacteria bacterium]|nr:hypothetical protein [Candidatus Parcubacteria bacterium]
MVMQNWEIKSNGSFGILRATIRHISHVATLPFNLGFLTNENADPNGSAFNSRIY